MSAHAGPLGTQVLALPGAFLLFVPISELSGRLAEKGTAWVSSPKGIPGAEYQQDQGLGPQALLLCPPSSPQPRAASWAHN